MRRQVLLNPGPACTSAKVKEAVIEFGDVCPREEETGNLMRAISDKVKGHLTSTPKDYEAVLFTSSGTGALESILSSLPVKEQKVLNIVNGEYGKRIHEILDTYKIPVVDIDFENGEIDLTVIKEYIDSGFYSHVAIVHCETTTGILNDIKTVAKMAKEKNLTVIVDAMSSAFAYPIDMEKDGIDFLACSSNKLAQGLPGIGIVVARKDLIQTCDTRSYYFSLKDQAEYFNKTNQMRFTPAVQILASLDTALDELGEEGIVNRLKRYSQLNQIIRIKMKSLGFDPVVELKSNSAIITAYYEPDGFNFNDFHDYLKDKNFIVYPGKLADNKSFRISNIGDLKIEEINNFLLHVSEYMKNAN
jgi:2-aminoethylphosphonate-pyruvate transaminase